MILCHVRLAFSSLSFSHRLTRLRRTMPKSANELYRLLASKKHGIPHFTPEPNENLPVDYQDVGVSIGDVGIWNEDSFDVLFNTCWSTSHAINVGGVPEDFTTFPVANRDISKRLYHSPGSVIASAKVTQVALNAQASSMVTPFFPATVGASVTFKVKSKECAILVLPEGASRERLLPVEKFRAHVRKHAQQWYTFAQDRLPSHGSLFVVTGCDKATSWGIATVSATSGDISVSLKFTAVGMVEGSVTPQYQWQDFGSATVRTSRQQQSPRPENQCIFIRGFFVPRRMPRLTLMFKKALSLGFEGTAVVHPPHRNDVVEIQRGNVNIAGSRGGITTTVGEGTDDNDNTISAEREQSLIARVNVLLGFLIERQ
ncbi:hypothetical protein C8R44DRAFT_856500 [Mycena epipterygia]|nr:hypothetical protein C8R44DRAFT_856500 [Mycena epipterygia]